MIDHIVAITPCKLVHKDSLTNFELQFGDSNSNTMNNPTFECHYGNDDTITTITSNALNSINTKRFDNDNNNKGIIFMITAGRNGLPKSFIDWICNLANSGNNNINIECLIYSSCNPKITYREMQLFLNSNAFILDDYVILDMHPSTKYCTFFALH